MIAFTVRVRTAHLSLSLFAIGPSSGTVQERMHDLFDLAAVTVIPL